MITQKYLKSVLGYNKETGVFVWLETRRNQLRVGDTAGYISPSGYVDIRIEGVLYKAHRLAWLYINGSFPAQCIDHINRDRGDNRITNLREASQSQNLANSEERTNNTSGYRGVCWDKSVGKWKARVSFNGRYVHVGYFDSPEQAYILYTKKRRELFGEFSP